MPPAARGTLFEKTVPLDPLQKLLFKFLYPKCGVHWVEDFGVIVINIFLLVAYPAAVSSININR
jgi:hypothetical protein